VVLLSTRKKMWRVKDGPEPEIVVSKSANVPTASRRSMRRGEESMSTLKRSLG